MFVPGIGLVRNRVTDPYSIEPERRLAPQLDRRRWTTPRLQPRGWARDAAPATVKRPTDMAIYELHVRDFSVNDASVPAAHRGKYLAFTDAEQRRHAPPARAWRRPA